MPLCAGAPLKADFVRSGCFPTATRPPGLRASDKGLPAGRHGEAAASLETTEALEQLEKALNPPFGYIDWPRFDELTKPGAQGFGWALDNSGIERVLVAFDGGASTPVSIGLLDPGPARVYPGYPGVEHAGFGFTIPELASGEHSLTVTIVAKDSGTAQIKSRFRIP